MVQIAEYGSNTCVSQYYTLEEWREFGGANRAYLKYISIACTPEVGEYEHLYNVLTALPDLKMISVPYIPKFSKHDFTMFIRKVRAAFPNHSVMAGNVMYQDTPKSKENKTYSKGSNTALPNIVSMQTEMKIPVLAETAEIDVAQGMMYLIS